ncbi:MAG: methionyl-tRNA formyltransferase [Nitrospirae bacterium GWB2_47_37]|nr:MAG: methionyl-tRNA formyltransferase [Nitrospirae bacterium GWB2_47_37]HAK87929.1 methionyl-tRNA formyltransferase [Nitrospiraceae bacterium]
MALIFFGTPNFAVPSLKALIDAGEDVALVVTQPDKVKGRGHILSAPPVKELALAHDIKVVQPAKIRDEDFYKELRAINPEFIIVVAYGRILPKEILEMPKFNCINVHASLLPKYRGAAPIQHALLNGEKKTGITTMLINEKLDTGDILLQREIEIENDDTSETLFERLSGLGANILIETIKGVREGNIKPVPQSGKTNYAPPLKKEDGRIDWNRTAVELFNFVRGMYPWPAAFCYLNNERIKIIKVRPVAGQGTPGMIEKAEGERLFVGTGEGRLTIEELQPEGKRAMPAASFLAGRKLREGYDTFS